MLVANPKLKAILSTFNEDNALCNRHEISNCFNKSFILAAAAGFCQKCFSIQLLQNLNKHTVIYNFPSLRINKFKDHQRIKELA